MANEYNFKTFRAKESPFHKEYVKDYKGKSPTLSVKLNKHMKNDLKKHFESIYDKDAMTKGINQILQDYLDTLCFDKKIFLDLEVIMLIPKSDNIHELEAKSQIIAFINHEVDFEGYYISNHRESDEYLTYDLMLFNETYFPMNLLRESDDSNVKVTSKENLDSFDDFKARQKELYEDIDLDDCYFVRFPLNNYLDNFMNGQYHHHSFRGNHLGLCVFEDILSDRKLFLIIDWYYQSEFKKQIQIDFQFAEDDSLLNWIKSNYGDDEIVIKAIEKAYNDDYRQSRLKLLEDDLLGKLEIVRSLQNVSDD